MTLVKLKHMSFRRLFTQLQRKHLIHVLSYISSLAMTMRICFCSKPSALGVACYIITPALSILRAALRDMRDMYGRTLNQTIP